MPMSFVAYKYWITCLAAFTCSGPGHAMNRLSIPTLCATSGRAVNERYNSPPTADGYSKSLEGTMSSLAGLSSFSAGLIGTDGFLPSSPVKPNLVASFSIASGCERCMVPLFQSLVTLMLSSQFVSPEVHGLISNSFRKSRSKHSRPAWFSLADESTISSTHVAAIIWSRPSPLTKTHRSDTSCLKPIFFRYPDKRSDNSRDACFSPYRLCLTCRAVRAPSPSNLG
mmetsp:Transcript_92023/g.183323  ORF Transcript_92023/g.183323 Transcript_92023/m.183323 type:complete len:226 (+) Transcript_92023:650-1327(+)